MKRKSTIPILTIISLLTLSALIFFAFYRPRRAANPSFTSVSPIHAIRVDYLDIGKSRQEVGALEMQMQLAGVNLVAIGAGRADWTYFPWRGHQDRWATEVRSNGIDYLAQDSERFGKWANVGAVIDVLAPLYIRSHPEMAAVSWTGKPSPNLVSTMELVDGQLGRDLLAMADEIAGYYPVNAIMFTELVYYVDGYGDQDRVAYLAYTGKTDWPRTADGQINIEDPTIGGWRSFEVARFLEKAAVIVHQHGKQLYLEVRVDVAPDGKVIINNGTNFDVFLAHVDRLVVWGNHNLNGQSQAKLEAVAQYLTGFGQNRVILGIGLWDKNYDLDVPNRLRSGISSPDFQAALEAARQGGMQDVWVTPSFLLDAGHWQVLKDTWSSP